MRLFFLVAHCKANHIECLIGELYVWKNLHVVCDETNPIVQENSLEDRDLGFQDKDSALEDETKVEELEQ